MKIIQLKVGDMDNFAYLVYDEKSLSCILIDPSWQSHITKQKIKSLNLSLKAVFLTHGHYDHINCLKDFLKEDKIKTHIHKSDLFLFEKDLPDAVFIKDKDILNFDGLSFSVIHTPGHTPGSVCYLIEGNLFTGDTLFIGTAGRVDLPRSNPSALRESLLKISRLPEDTIIWPGHAYNGEKTDLKTQKNTNPCFLNIANEEDFISTVL